MKVKQYDKILLKDKRTATVVEVLEEDKAYIVDVDLSDMDWETIEITQNEIEKVIKAS